MEKVRNRKQAQNLKSVSI